MAKTIGKGGLLTPQNSALIMIDYQPQMFFGVQSVDRQLLINNIVGLAKSAKIFKVPTILTTIAAESFSGPDLPEMEEVFPGIKPIDRTNMNAWEDKRVVDAVKKTGRGKLIMAGLWTEVCVAFPALSALADGYEVYVVADAIGGSTQAAHEFAMQRMVQAGIIPVTWLQVLLEYQRDWARAETYDATLDIVRKHAGAYGQGVLYVKTMLGKYAKAA
jgi:nicotinamidase-related amidase